MTPIKSTNLDALNARFAEKVAGWMPHRTRGFVMDGWRDDNGCFQMRPTDFCRNADAVLSWLDKWIWRAQRHLPGFGVTVEIHRHDMPLEWAGRSSGETESFPHAAVIALLRAHGQEVRHD